MKKKIKFQHRLEYGALRTVETLLGLFPLVWISTFVSGVLRVLFRIHWPEKRETVRRIREVFGADVPLAKCRQIARASLCNMLMNMVEMMRVQRFTPAWLEEHIEGAHEAQKIIQDLIAKHGGVVIALPHMGNWDLAGYICLNFGIRLMALARKQNNPLVEAWLVRNRHGNFEALDRTSSATFIKIGHHLKSGGAFAILPDVRGTRPDFQIDFLGHPAVLTRGMARFARMSDVPILPFIAQRVGRTHHKLIPLAPIYPNEDVHVDEDLHRMTEEVMQQFEKVIRANPEQWFWYNRRWILTPLGQTTR